jgi:hypothetical protein
LSSKLPPETLPLNGYSGKKGRHLVNNLAAAFTPYVEVGCFQGSTLICAAYENQGRIIGVDNFTDETKPGRYMVENRKALLANLSTYSHVARPSVIDGACWDLKLSGFRCCFYDGAHAEDDHRRAITDLLPWFTQQFVFVVDDFNRDNVRAGTEEGLHLAGLLPVFHVHLGKGATDDADGWWNGIGVYVLENASPSEQPTPAAWQLCACSPGTGNARPAMADT